MKYLLYLAIFACSFVAGDFKSTQLSFPRVKDAFSEKQELVRKAFTAQGLDLDKSKIFIRVFKKDKALELWAANTGDKVFKLIKTYEICALSGTSGPKRKGGDGQTPEGFYYIDRFNPSSNFHLSLGINYPNASDKALGGGNYMGGDIFIHGNCVTIGCMPITDDKIKELYLAAVIAKQNGQQKIPVHIFPTRLTASNVVLLGKEHAAFWENIKTGYDLFEEKKMIPEISVDSKSGKYLYK
jgi:murein L,D-transpeptidase YafK